ncbi:FMN reductase [Pseudaminobacter soli (ex Li et al. 2025)]|uniref:FMN reductase n=1 Tax=Pseudaminobacter soli (ex Li et al. 2025) TaxID=1295366 RepID=A0A2P7RSL0_9HYPH|nr:FMN reductase [Mesorhizobium soli]PSJ53198.1 FMN reductase [Mesorhizobium soli]
MKEPRIVGISGNARRPSKTRALVCTVAERIAQRHGFTVDLFDLVDLGPSVETTREEASKETTRVLEAIEGADALIVGTPVYKGAYAGLLKHLFDLIDPLALKDRPVLLTAVGGGQRHSLIIEHHLRPLFGFFEALTIPTGVYASEQDVADGKVSDTAINARIDHAVDQLGVIIRTEAFRAA